MTTKTLWPVIHIENISQVLDNVLMCHAGVTAKAEAMGRILKNTSHLFWLCSRCVLVFQPPRANTDGGVATSPPRAANTALK